MATTPVTRDFYYSLTKHRPKEWRYDSIDDTLPATHVTWEDAVRFCNALSLSSGRPSCYRRTASGWDCDWAADGYRLPTEAEWEYACRAGTETPWFWGADQGQAGRYAWFSGNSGGQPHPVATKDPNPWGLYDLAGNCWEWCWDGYGPYDPQAVDDPRGAVRDGRRVVRGGSFIDEPRILRSAVRGRFTPDYPHEAIGFRCVRGAGRPPVA